MRNDRDRSGLFRRSCEDLYACWSGSIQCTHHTLSVSTQTVAAHRVAVTRPATLGRLSEQLGHIG